MEKAKSANMQGEALLYIVTILCLIDCTFCLFVNQAKKPKTRSQLNIG